MALNPSASGVATAADRSTSSTPVAARAVTSSPLRTASAHRSSTIAAVSVASTWSATAGVTRTPSPAASDRAPVVTAAVSCRRCRVRARSSSPSIPAAASRSALPRSSTWVTWSASRRTSRLTTQAASEGFFSAFTGAASSVPLSSLARASRAGVNSPSGSAYSSSAISSSPGLTSGILGIPYVPDGTVVGEEAACRCGSRRSAARPGLPSPCSNDATPTTPPAPAWTSHRPPTRSRDVLRRLGAEPWDIARERESREAGFGDLPRHPDRRDEWIAGLVTHPRAIQRPIILLDDGTAVVARDAEALDRILGV